MAMILPTPEFEAALSALMPRILPGAQRVAALRRLSAGATLETWSFDAVGEGFHHPLILRRSPGGLRAAETLSIADEADLVRALAGSGVPVAPVVHTLRPEDALGDGFLMTRIEGETIPRKILRDARFDAVRPKLAARFGAILGALHRVDLEALPRLADRTTAKMIDGLHWRYQHKIRPSAVMDYAFAWLRERQPEDPPVLRLVHGDFRNGNVIIGEDDVRAVLDWEIAHLGDPAEDLAWVCVAPWRFGNLDLPVGGVGTREQMFEAYEAVTGEPVDRDRVRWWEALGSLRWAIGCAGMAEWFRSGRDASVERAMIARRTSESEMDLMRIIGGRIDA